MTLLEELAAALSGYLADQTCAGPDCALIVEETEVFCSLACRTAFDGWAEEMRADYDAHDVHWTEIGAL